MLLSSRYSSSLSQISSEPCVSTLHTTPIHIWHLRFVLHSTVNVLWLHLSKLSATPKKHDLSLSFVFLHQKKMNKKYNVPHLTKTCVAEVSTRALWPRLVLNLQIFLLFTLKLRVFIDVNSCLQYIKKNFFLFNEKITLFMHIRVISEFAMFTSVVLHSNTNKIDNNTLSSNKLNSPTYQ